MKNFSELVKLSNSVHPYLTLELTNLCNYKCLMCYRENVDIKNKGFMSSKLFSEVVDSFKNTSLFFEGLKLSWLGEALMHPEIEEILKKLQHNSFFFKNLILDTNVSFLNEVLINRLNQINRNVFLFLSIDASNSRTYSKIRKNGEFKKIVDNIKKLVENRKKNIFLRFQFIIMEENRNEISPFIKMCNNFISDLPVLFEEKTTVDFDYIFFRKLVSPGKQRKVDKMFEDMRTKFEHKIIEKKPLKNLKSSKSCCQNLWSMPFIRWNGQVGFCNLDPAMSLSPGNVNYESFINIWFGEKAQKIRKMHLNRNYPDKCKNCPGFKSDISEKIIQRWFQVFSE
ncbi:MAG: SPASM domain-containing protein [Candidatus Muiribacteriota bacterium]